MVLEDDMEPIPFVEAAALMGVTPEALRKAHQRGYLQAKKIGRNWTTTRRWLNEWNATTRRPRGNPKLKA